MKFNSAIGTFISETSQYGIIMGNPGEDDIGIQTSKRTRRNLMNKLQKTISDHPLTFPSWLAAFALIVGGVLATNVTVILAGYVILLFAMALSIAFDL